MQYITAFHKSAMHTMAFMKMQLLRHCSHSNHSILIEGLMSVKPNVDPHMQHLYRAIYSEPIHEKLLTETEPWFIDQYRGCIHLAKYCMAARDGCVLPGVLHTAESLLKDTLHLDPCSGHIKLAFLYMTTGDFVKAMDRLDVAENNFLLKHKNMGSSVLINLLLNGIVWLHSAFISVVMYTLSLQR